MRRITILCKNQYIEEVREKAKNIFKHDVLKTPLSGTGELPASHWICVLHVNDEKYNELMLLKEKSIMIEKSAREILKEFNLKKINESNK
jgi:hypothetical protein